MAKNVQPKKDKPLPQCKAILLCEHTIVDPKTEKVSLIGIIRLLHGLIIPGKTEPMEVFLQLVDGIGSYDITLQVHDLAMDETIAKGKGPSVNFPDPLVVRQLILPIPALPMTH